MPEIGITHERAEAAVAFIDGKEPDERDPITPVRDQLVAALAQAEAEGLGLMYLTDDQALLLLAVLAQA